MRIRALRSLVVTMPHGTFTMSVGKSQSTSIMDHLERLVASFVKKAAACSACNSFGVAQSATILDETVQVIFTDTFVIPYEDDADWEYPAEGTTGLLKLVMARAPSTAGTDDTGARSTATGTAPRRSKKEVLPTLYTVVHAHTHRSDLVRKGHCFLFP